MLAKLAAELRNVAVISAPLMQHSAGVFSSSLILLGYFASLSLGNDNGKSPLMYCAILMAVLVGAQLAPPFMGLYVSKYMQMMLLLLRCILDVILFFVFGQDLNTARDSPMNIPMEFMYVIPLIACVFVIPVIQQVLSVSSLIVLCVILSSDVGTAHPYTVDPVVGIAVFVLLAVVYASPTECEPRLQPVALENTVATCAKYVTGIIFIYAYSCRPNAMAHQELSGGGHRTIVRDFYSLRYVTNVDALMHNPNTNQVWACTISSIFIRLHLVLSTTNWFTRLRLLVKKNLSLSITLSDQYTSDIHELFVACAVFIVMIAAFSVSKVCL